MISVVSSSSSAVAGAGRSVNVFTGIDRYACQPSFFGGISSKAVQIPVGFDECFLYRIFRLLLIV